VTAATIYKQNGHEFNTGFVLLLKFVMTLSIVIVGRDSSVGIATCYGLDGPVTESRWGERYSAPVQTGPGAHPASYKMGTGSLSRG